MPKNAIRNVKDFIDFLSPIFLSNGFKKKGNNLFIKKENNCEKIFQFDLKTLDRFMFYYKVNHLKFKSLCRDILYPGSPLSQVPDTLTVYSFSKFTDSKFSKFNGYYSLDFKIDEEKNDYFYDPLIATEIYSEIDFIFKEYCIPFYQNADSLKKLYDVIRNINLFSMYMKDYLLSGEDVILKDLLLTLIINPDEYEQRKEYYSNKVNTKPVAPKSEINKYINYNRSWNFIESKIPLIENIDFSKYKFVPSTVPSVRH